VYETVPRQGQGKEELLLREACKGAHIFNKIALKLKYFICKIVTNARVAH
jgi:hypothetical protein